MAKKPVFAKIGPGVGLGYRRNQTAGTWVVWVADGRGGNWTKAIGSADDFEEADSNNTLDFWQAQDRARAVARGGRTVKATMASQPRSAEHLVATKPISGLAAAMLQTSAVSGHTFVNRWLTKEFRS